jgi:branched-chain amino acid transport system permease protein
MASTVTTDPQAGDAALERRAKVLRNAPKAAAGLVVALVALWILLLAEGTPAGPAVANPGRFLVTLLDGLTFAGLLFVVASGFTLIFGLMRTVNMAHGSLFLLSAFVAIRVQQTMVGRTRNIAPAEISLARWFVPLLVGALVAAIVGVLMQQIFLRWNQGEELRQALITLAISVILADQMLREFGGLALTMVWPGQVTHFIDVFGQRYATSRLFMLAVALVVGILLWLWLTKTRMGMVIRAGVDDENMVRALGINITLVFAMTFFIGAFLAGLGGAMGASFAGVSTGSDGNWLLNSLVVVIIGGLGSIKGAVAGSVLYGVVVAFSPAYMPTRYTFYSIILTFVLLALVLAVRPYGLFGRTE